MYRTDARELEKASEYDIIVVRGLTSRALSLKYPEITMVDIRMDAFDVATALLEAKKKYPGMFRIGLILPKASICTTELLSELTVVDVVMREAHGEGEMVSHTYIRIREEGFTYLIHLGYPAYGMEKMEVYIPNH